MLPDIDLEWGGDLGVSSIGDLLVSSESVSLQQRLCRRLLTNPGDYIWNLDYGGGLPKFIGSPASAANIEAVIRAQIQLESSILQSPSPQITTILSDVANGYFTTTIKYTDPSTQHPSVLNISLG